jgi:exonuclease SbcC
MIRIGHCSDLHLASGQYYAETYRCLEYVVEDGAKQGVQLWLVVGDVAGREVPHTPTVEEFNGLDVIFQRMAASAPLYILRGNHCNPAALLGFGRLAGNYPITVINEPEVIELPDGMGTLFCLPYPDTACLLSADEMIGGSLKDMNRAAADKVRDLLRSWRENRAHWPGPHILMAHINIAGSQTAGGEVMAAKEVELFSEDLARFAADYAALGHIHLQQAMTPSAWYSGSPSAQDFGAVDPKGYLIVDVEANEAPVIHRRETGSCPMVTVQAEWLATERRWDVKADDMPTDARVRVQFKLPEAEMGTEDRAALTAQIAELGIKPDAIVLDPRVIPTTRVRSETIAGASSTAARLEAYWDSLDEKSALTREERDRCLLKLPTVETEVDPAAAPARDSIVLHSLKGKGCCNDLREPYEIDFDTLGDGVIALVGPIGSGKTHILDQAGGPMALYNESPYYDNASFGDHVPKDIVDAHFDLEFSHDGKRYRSQIKHDPQFGGNKGKTEGFVWEDGVAVAKSGTMGDYFAAMEKIAPSKKILYLGAYAAQGDVGNFFDYRKAEKRDIFAEMLGMAHHQAQSKLAGIEADREESALAATRQRIADLSAKLERAQAIAAELGLLDARHADLVTAAAERQTDVAACQERLTEAREALARAETKAQAATSERARLTTAGQDGATTLSTINAEIAALNELLAQRETVEKECAALANVETALKVAQEDERAAGERYRDLQVAAAEAAAEVTALTADWERLTGERKAAEAAAAQLEGQGDAEGARATAQASIESLDTEITASAARTVELQAVVEAEVERGRERTSLKDCIEDFRAQAETVRFVDGQLTCAKCGTDVCDCFGLVARAAINKSEAAKTALAALPEPNPQLAIDLREHLAAHQALTLKRKTAERALSDAQAQLLATESARATAAKLPGIRTELQGVAERGKIAAEKARESRVDRDAANAALLGATNRRTVGEQNQAVLKPAVEKRVRIEAAETQLAQTTQRRERESAKLHDLEIELAALGDAGDAEAALVPLRSQVETAQAAVTTAETERATCQTALQAAKDSIARLQGERTGLGDPEAEIARLNAAQVSQLTEITDWRRLEKGLGRDGVQSLLIDQAGPAVSGLCNELLSACFNSRFSISLVTQEPTADGKKMKEVFEVRIFDARAGMRIDKGSGGQMRVIGKAFRLAIAIWNVQQSGRELRTLWEDEATDGLDAESKAQYVPMLRRAREIGKFRQVLFIAHDEAVWSQADGKIIFEGGTIRQAA